MLDYKYEHRQYYSWMSELASFAEKEYEIETVELSCINSELVFKDDLINLFLENIKSRSAVR